MVRHLSIFYKNYSLQFLNEKYCCQKNMITCNKTQIYIYIETGDPNFILRHNWTRSEEGYVKEISL